MSMARPKESLIVDAIDIRHENTSLLIKNSGTCPVPPQGVLKRLITSFPAAILRDPPEADHKTTERREGRYRHEIDSHLTQIPSSNGPYPASSVASSQGSSGKHAQATVQHNRLVREITSRSRSLSTSRRSSTLAPAEEQPEWQSDIVDFGHELKSAVDDILQDYPKYTGFFII